MRVLIDWTDALHQELLDLSDQGLSAGAIAKGLDLSRDAVIARLRKLRRPGAVQPNASTGAYEAVDPLNLSAVAAATAGEDRPSCVTPPGAWVDEAATLPPVVVNLQTTGGLSPDLYGPCFGQSDLTERRTNQCCFPLWPNKAMPDHPDYGRVCGAQVAPNKSGERRKSHCPHHQSVVNSKAETEKAKRIVKATVRRARAQGVA